MKTQFAHIQISREANAMIYVVEVSEVSNLLDELVAKIAEKIEVKNRYCKT